MEGQASSPLAFSLIRLDALTNPKSATYGLASFRLFEVVRWLDFAEFHARLEAQIADKNDLEGH